MIGKENNSANMLYLYTYKLLSHNFRYSYKTLKVTYSKLNDSNAINAETVNLNYLHGMIDQSIPKLAAV
jgi:hypothetical protein